MSHNDKKDKSDSFALNAAGLGTQLAVAIGLGVYCGLKLDSYYGIQPFGILFGVGLAFVYGGYEVWKILRKMK